MIKKNSILDYLTHTWSFVAFLSIFVVTFSLAIFLRYELTKIKAKDFFKMSPINAEHNNESWKAENLEKNLVQIYERKMDCLNKTVICKNIFKNGKCDYLVKNFCGDASWVIYRDKCFKIFNEKKTWEDATTSCLDSNATLMEIGHDNLNKFLNSLVSDLNITEDIFFISLKQTGPKNNWFWSSDKKSENFSENRKCTELIVSNNRQYFGKFNDFRCDLSKQKFICQKKIESYHEKVQDYLYFNLLKQSMSIQLLKELEKLTTDMAFFNLKNAHNYLITIIKKILKFNESNFEAFSVKFNILNNILNGASAFFKNKPNLSISLVYAFEELVKQISTKYSKPFNYSCSNFMININDYPFVNRNNSNDLNYFPMTQEFYKIYEIHEITELSILSKIKPKNAVIIKDKQSMFPGEFNSILDSLKTRISIVYFKNSKLFQSEEYFLSSPIINVMFFVISNMTSTFISNQIEYKTNFRKNESIDQASIKCVNWNIKDGKGAWTERNCRFLKHDPLSDTVKCTCNQSNIVGLAYKFFTYRKHLNKTEIFLNLKSLNNIGLMFSSVCLLATLFSNLNIRKIKKSKELKITVTLASNLFISNVLFFLISIITPSINRNCCLAFGALLHYFLLSSYMLYLTNSLIQFSTLIYFLEDKINNSYHKWKFFTFVIPALIPLVVLCTDHTLYINQNRSICWLNGMGLYIAFIIPTAFISFLNFGFLFSMIYYLFKQREQVLIVSRKKITISSICFILKTQTWLIGLYLLFEYDLDIFSEVSFCISNTLLGLFIFITYAYLTKPKSSLWRNFYDYKQSKSKLEQIFFIDKKLTLRPMIKIWRNSISESFSDSHNYEELMNASNYKLNGSLENTSGYNSKPNSYSTALFEDDVALRIEKLNQSLIRIKALNREISFKNGKDTLDLSELPSFY